MPPSVQYAELAEQQHRRFIKTHTPLDGIPLDPRVSYIVTARHPLDTFVSLCRHNEIIGHPPVDFGPPPGGFGHPPGGLGRPPEGFGPPPGGSALRRGGWATLRGVSAARQRVSALRQRGSALRHRSSTPPASPGHRCRAGRPGRPGLPHPPCCRRRRHRDRPCHRRCCTTPCSTGSPAMTIPAGTLTHCPASCGTCQMPGPGEAGRTCCWCTTTTCSADLEGQMRWLAGRLGIAVPENAWPALIQAATLKRMRDRAESLIPSRPGGRQRRCLLLPPRHLGGRTRDSQRRGDGWLLRACRPTGSARHARMAALAVRPGGLTAHRRAGRPAGHWAAARAGAGGPYAGAPCPGPPGGPALASRAASLAPASPAGPRP